MSRKWAGEPFLLAEGREGGGFINLVAAGGARVDSLRSLEMQSY